MKELTVGERGLIRRALLYYINGERSAIHDAAVKARDTNSASARIHAADVKRQADQHIEAATALIEKLMLADKAEPPTRR